MARFLADEDVFTVTVRLVRERGFHVDRIQDLGLGGAKDPEVLRQAQERNAVLITNDQGFADIRTYPPSSHYGIIVLKMDPDPQKVRAVHKVLDELLQNEADFGQVLFIVDTGKYRKRTVS